MVHMDSSVMGSLNFYARLVSFEVSAKHVCKAIFLPNELIDDG